MLTTPSQLPPCPTCGRPFPNGGAPAIPLPIWPTPPPGPWVQPVDPGTMPPYTTPWQLPQTWCNFEAWFPPPPPPPGPSFVAREVV